MKGVPVRRIARRRRILERTVSPAIRRALEAGIRLYRKGARGFADPTRLEERWGKWSHTTVGAFTARAAGVSGDFAEIGVAYGETFVRLVPAARAQGKRAHAFDSFEGMSAPGEFDRAGDQGGHPQGQFSVGGVECFRQILDNRNLDRADYRLHSGFVPDCFDDYDGSEYLSLAIVDLDHYAPTRDALSWVWPRINVGGYMLLDDFAPGSDMESTKAINTFLRDTSDFQVMDYYNHQLMLRKVSLQPTAT